MCGKLKGIITRPNHLAKSSTLLIRYWKRGMEYISIAEPRQKGKLPIARKENKQIKQMLRKSNKVLTSEENLNIYGQKMLC